MRILNKPMGNKELAAEDIIASVYTLIIPPQTYILVSTIAIQGNVGIYSNLCDFAKSVG